MRRFVIGGFVVAIIIVVFLLFQTNTQNRTQQDIPNSTLTPQVVNDAKSQEVDFRASFLIFTNGTQRNFSEDKYHNQSEDAFIEGQDPSVVFVKKSRVTWGDFFSSLPDPFRLTNTCLYTGTGQIFCNGEAGELLFYKNRALTPNLLEQEMQNGDQVLITFGNLSEQQILTQLNLIPTP